MSPAAGLLDPTPSTMEETLRQILAGLEDLLRPVHTRPELEAARAAISGPNGTLTGVLRGLGQVPKEERPALGRRVNEVKVAIEAQFAVATARVEQAELAARLGPPTDPSLPTVDGPPGGLHLLTQVRDEISAIFRQIGFVIAEGPEVETEFYCFDALNTPPEHPARDLQDTYFLPTSARVGNVSRRGDERYLLRTHTSSVQIRTMLSQPPPLRIISPGRCYRRDTVDATHSASFHQIEGLYVDRNVSVRDLKAVLDHFLKTLLGPETETRFRPHFFPYTEPSFEVDFRSRRLGKLSDRWIEILGCGMVDPAVFQSVGYDAEVWSGYAFGMGIERLAMLLHGVDDIRHFYANDLRFLRQFT